jgi:hypothetical protein
MKFESFKSWLNENVQYDNDMWIEFGYFNKFLSRKLKESEFKNLIETSKVQNVNYKNFTKIYQRYDEDFNKLVNAKNTSLKQKIEWWKPKYLQMKKFEKEKQSDEYYYKLVNAIKEDKVTTPIIVLSINDETKKNYKFICGGRNRMILSYILQKPIKTIIITLPAEKKENIKKIIDNRNR